MSDIDSTLFSSSEKLPKEFWASVGLPDLSTRNAGDFLSKHGWDGKAAAAVGLRLTPDNRSPEAARLILVGEWDKPIRIQANRVFQGADQEILMEIQLDDLSTFKCRENRMASMYVPSNMVTTKYTRKKKELSEEQLAEEGIGEFSLRTICSISKSSGKKYGNTGTWYR